VYGPAVTVANRLEELGVPGLVHVSAEVARRAKGGGFVLESRGVLAGDAVVPRQETFLLLGTEGERGMLAERGAGARHRHGGGGRQ
jgi:class 3 adenylate cyclase